MALLTVRSAGAGQPKGDKNQPMTMRSLAAKNGISAKGNCLALLVAGCLAIGGGQSALADAEMRNPNIEVVYQSDSKTATASLKPQATSFDVSLNGKPLYSTWPPQKRLSFGRAFVSNDGQSVTWLLEDRFSGNINPVPGITDPFVLHAPALICFYMGKLIKSYSLAELLVRTNMLSVSVSHTQWIPETRDVNWKSSPTVTYDAGGARLEFETTSMRHYVIDPQTGAMLTGEDTKIWNDAEVIVFGELTGGEGKLALKWAKFAKGKIDNVESITIFDPTATYTAGSHAVALRKVMGFWTTSAPEYKVPVFYNLL